MSGAFEGDLIRPLGLVTLYMGYAEYELDVFLERLASAKVLRDSRVESPIGQKLALLKTAIGSLDATVVGALDALIEQGHSLLRQRNSLIHGCVLAGGRVISARPGVDESRTSPEALTSLAEQIFSWKEHMNSYRQEQIEPLLAVQLTPAAPSNRLERQRRE